MPINSGGYKYFYPEEVPPAVRAEAEAKYPPSALPPAQLNWEQEYEARQQKLPPGPKQLAPRTLGEFTGQATQAALAPLAPYSPIGAGVIAPMAAAAAGGYMEEQKGPFPIVARGGFVPGWQKGGQIPWPTEQRVIDALQEAAKQGLVLIGSKLLSAGGDWAVRKANEAQMLGKSASRMGRAVVNLLNAWPKKLPMPETADELTRVVANGELKGATGAAYETVKEDIVKAVPPYTGWGLGPGGNYTPPSGLAFRMPVPKQLANGSVVMDYENMNAQEAMNYLKRLLGGSYTPAGNETGGQMSGFMREARHDGREIFLATLRKGGFGDLADRFEAASADYGAAATVTDIFINARRPDGLIDQEVIRRRLGPEMEHLNNLFKDGRAVEFQSAVAPGGRAVISGSEWSGTAAAGTGRGYGHLHFPTALRPENPEDVPAVGRFLASPAARPLLSYPLVQSSKFWGPWLARREIRRMQEEGGGGEGEGGGY